MTAAVDIVSLGEPLVEFNQIRAEEPHTYLQGFGGDTSNALIAASAPPDRPGQRSSHGTTYGLVYLANGLGFALGPLSGGLIAATLGLRDVFFVTAAILLAIGIYLPFGVKDRRSSAAS